MKHLLITPKGEELFYKNIEDAIDKYFDIYGFETSLLHLCSHLISIL